MDVFAANDLCAFITTAGTPTESTNTSVRDATYTPKAIFLENAAHIRSARFINPDTGASTSLTEGWLHFDMYWSIGTNGVNGGAVFLVNDAGVQVIRIYADRTSGLRLDYWDGSAWVAGGDFLGGTEGSLNTFDLHFICGASGELNLYVNEGFEPSLSISGLNAAVTNAAYVDFADNNVIVAASLYASQILVSDNFTLGAKVGSLVPTAAGTNTAWAGTYTDVVKTGFNDTTYIESTTAGEKETYAATDHVLPAFSYLISGVWVNIRGKNGTADPTGITAAVRTGGADFNTGYNYPNLTDVGFGPGISGFSLNPDTGLAWTISEVNAAEVGVESVA